MKLPGGFVTENGARLRDVDIRTVTGAVELALYEAASGPAGGIGRTAWIDRVISAAVALPSADASPTALTVGDRHFLLVQIARALGLNRFWLTGTCRACAEPFDACIELDAFPVKPPDQGFPFASVDLPSSSSRIRAPTGADLAAVAKISDPRDAIDALARRLVCPGAALPEQFDDDTLAAIDQAVQAISPEAAQSLSADCPECGAQNDLPLDIPALLARSLRDPLNDVHEIAGAYHWSEDAILALPRSRRLAYLDRIARDRGTVQ